MARRSWDALSAAYRARLQRGGVTEADYRAGRSLQAARGHATTPESPSRAFRQPGRYERWFERHPSYRTGPPPDVSDLGPDFYHYETGDFADVQDFERSIGRNPTYLLVYRAAGAWHLFVWRPRKGRRRAA